MSPRPLIVAALLLLALGGFALLRTAGDDKGASGDPAERAADPRPPRLAERPPVKSPTKRLRSLVGTPLASAPRFETVERWAAALSDGELRELVDEAGMEGHAGLAGWLRCALYAEWGRRDPRAAAASLQGRGKPASNWDHARSQAWFSLYRGWAEVDPEAALASLDAATELPESAFGLNDTARSKARTAIYRELARRHPGDLWELATRSPEGPHDPVVMRGLLKGPRASIEALVGRWTDTVWREPFNLEGLKAYHNMLNSNFSGFVHQPPAEQIARETALALAERDFDAGLSWIRESDLGLEADTRNRVFGFHDDWARRHPREALERIAANRDPERNKVLAYGVLAGDPSLGPELVAHFDQARDRWDVIFTAMSSGSNHHVDDFYPAPGQANALRDFEANYHAILATMEAAELPADREADLLKRVHEEFCRTVPAAAEAAGYSRQAR